MSLTCSCGADPPERYSTVGTFPQAEYAPYSHPEYIWNQAAGSNAYPSSSMWFPMPVFLLTPDLAVDAQQRAAYNTNQVCAVCARLASIDALGIAAACLGGVSRPCELEAKHLGYSANRYFTINAFLSWHACSISPCCFLPSFSHC